MTCSVKSLDLHLRLLPSSMIFDCFFLQRSSILNGWLEIGLATVDHLVLLPARLFLPPIVGTYAGRLNRRRFQVANKCYQFLSEGWPCTFCIICWILKLEAKRTPYMKTRTWWNYFIEKSYWGWRRVHPSRWLSLAFEPGVGQLFYSCASNGEFFYFRSTLWQLDISVNRVKGGLIEIVQKVWIRVQLWRWFLQDGTTGTHYLRADYLSGHPGRQEMSGATKDVLR